MTPVAYPIALVLEGKRVLLVGGGKIACEKIEPLLRSGARLTVVSPTARAEIVAIGERHHKSVRNPGPMLTSGLQY